MFFIFILLIAVPAMLNGMQLSWDNADNTQEICATVLKMVKPIDISESTLNHVNDFLKEKGIVDYQSASKIGLEENFISNPKEFNLAMIKYFPNITGEKTEDFFPKISKKYQAVILPLSGIDGYVRRAEAYKRLFVLNGFTTKKIYTLVAGERPHRTDLMTEDYLTQLPQLFSSVFDLKDNQETLRNKAKELLKKESWTLEDGAQAAWTLLESDPIMKDAHQKFSYFKKEKCKPEELFENFSKEGLEEPITEESPIAIITQNFGFANLEKSVRSGLGENFKHVDFFIPQDLPSEVQERLFNHTPHQEAVTRLFQFRNYLLKKVSNK